MFSLRTTPFFLCAIFVLGCSVATDTDGSNKSNGIGATHWVDGVFAAYVGEEGNQVTLFGEHAELFRYSEGLKGGNGVTIECDEESCTLFGVEVSAEFEGNFWGEGLRSEALFSFSTDFTAEDSRSAREGNVIANTLDHAFVGGLTSSRFMSCWSRDDAVGTERVYDWNTFAGCAFRPEHTSSWGAPPRDRISRDLLINEDVDGTHELWVEGELASQIKELLESGSNEEWVGLQCTPRECLFEADFETSIFAGVGFLATFEGHGAQSLAALLEAYPEAERTEAGTTWKNLGCTRLSEGSFCYIIAEASAQQE